MSSNNNVISLSWKDIDKIIKEFINNIKVKPDFIVAIQRGGLVPAVMLSHALKVRDVIPLNIKVTQDDSINSFKTKPIIIHNPNMKIINGKKVLLVDDIVGSGYTYQVAIKYLHGYHPELITSLICVVNKNNWEKANSDSPDKYINNIGMLVRGWTEFPWERV